MADLHTYKKLPSDPCLTQEQITAYIDGDLSSAEMHACEKHILDCEMCEDAVEGLSLVKDRSVLTAPMKTAETVAPPAEGKVIPLQQPNRRVWYAAAAVLVLVLGTTFMLRMLSTDRENAMAENAEVKADSIQQSPGTGYALEKQEQVNADCLSNTRTELKAPPMATTEGQTFAEATEADDAPQAVSHNWEMEREDIVMEPATPPVAADESVDGDLSNNDRKNLEEETVDGKTKQEKANKKALLGYAKDALTSGGVATQDKKDAYVDANRTDNAPKTTANAPASNNAQTFTLGNSNGTDTSTKYGAVSSEAISVVRADSATVDQLELSYRNGVTQLNAGQVNSAIALFDKVLADKNHARYQDAEFQKAKALIKANRKEEAKTLLKSIEAKKGKHAAEATELLKTL